MKRGQKNKPSSAVEERRFSAASTSQSVNRASAPDTCHPERSKPIRPLNRFAKSKNPYPPAHPPASQGISTTSPLLHRTGTDRDGREARPRRTRVLLVPLTRQTHTRASALRQARTGRARVLLVPLTRQTSTRASAVRQARPARSRVLLVPFTPHIHTRASAPEDALRAPATHSHPVHPDKLSS